MNKVYDSHIHTEQFKESKKKRKNYFRCCEICCCYWFKKCWSVQTTFVIAFMFSTLCTGAIFWIVGFWFSNVSTNHLSNLTRRYRLESLSNDFNFYISEGAKIIDHVNHAYSRKNYSFHELPTYRDEQFELLFRLMVTTKCSGVLYADKYGWFIGAFKYYYANGTVEYQRYWGDNSTLEFDIVDPEDGSLVEWKSRVNNYTCIYRPWFTSAFENDGDKVWSPIFLSLEDPPRLDATIGQAYYTEGGEKIGVMAFGHSFNEIDNHISELEKEEGEVILMIDTDGKVISTSDPDEDSFYSWYDETAGKMKHKTIYPHEHGNDLVQFVGRYLEAEFGGYDRIVPTESSLKYNPPGRKYGTQMIDIMEFDDGIGMKLNIIEIVPRKNTFAKVDETNYIFIGISILLFIIGLVCSLVLGMCISRPIKRATREIINASELYLKERRDIFACGEKVITLSEFRDMDKGMSRLRQGLKNFSKYLPSEVVTQFIKEGLEAKLSVEKCEITVMFMDIENFTAKSEKMNEYKLIQFLSEFFDSNSEIIQNEFDGTIDKYIGDCIMAFWNRPKPVKNHQLKAVQCALHVVGRLDERNEKITKEGDEDYYDMMYTVRVGINSGSTLVGNVGSNLRMNYTCLGDCVNVAARLEPLNKDYLTKIMISESVHEEVNSDICCHWVDRTNLRGKSMETNIYQVLGSMENATDGDLELSKFFLDCKEMYEKVDWDGLEEKCLHISEEYDSYCAQKLLRKVKRIKKGVLLRDNSVFGNLKE